MGYKEDSAILSEYNQEIHKLKKFIDLCDYGLHNAAVAVNNFEAQKKLTDTLRRPDLFYKQEEQEQVKDKLKKIETFALEQKGRGFPYLYSLCTVNLWTILEAMAEDITIHLLKKPDIYKQSDKVQSIEGPLITFMVASPEEQAEMLAEKLKYVTKSPYKLGVAKFEDIFSSIGFGGPIHDEVRRTLYELSQIRNVFVHNMGIADSIFLNKCPWINMVTGDRIMLNGNHFNMYLMAVGWYIFEIDDRFYNMEKKGYSEDNKVMKDKIIESLNICRDRAKNYVAS